MTDEDLLREKTEGGSYQTRIRPVEDYIIIEERAIEDNGWLREWKRKHAFLTAAAPEMVRLINRAAAPSGPPAPDYEVDPNPPKLKRDLAGRLVRLKREVRNGGGQIFGAGTIMRIRHWYRGLHLEQESVCEHCGCGEERTVTRVQMGSVELLKEK